MIAQSRAGAEKILFGQSYFLRFDPKLWAAMQPYPPLGTLYAASYIRGRGYSVDLFDAMLAESESEWDVALARSQPKIAVLYEDNFNYLSKMCLLRMRQAAFSMIDMARQRGCTVIVAGSDATDHAQDYLNAGAKYVLIGEGEQTLGDLLDYLVRHHGGQATLDAIQGLAFERAGQLVVTPHRPDLKDLDSLPFPAWDLVDIERYRSVWYERHGYYSMNVATARGCPYHCNWCAKPIWGQRYHVRSPENVVAELAWLKRTYEPDHMWMVDDIFGLVPGWVERFSELVEQKDARLPFKSLQRVDLILKGNTIEALRRAGAQRIWVGGRVWLAENPGCDGKGHPGGTHLPGRATLARGWDPGRVFSAVRVPGRNTRGHRTHAADGARLPSRRYRHVGVVPHARYALLCRRAARAWDQAELAGLRRPGDAVSRAVQYGVLPYAAQGAPP